MIKFIISALALFVSILSVFKGSDPIVTILLIILIYIIGIFFTLKEK